MAQKEAVAEKTAAAGVPVAPLLAAWLLPGGGHLVLRRWGRGALLLASITIMFLLGIGMKGRLFHFDPANVVEMLGFVGDLCAGALFLAAKLLGYDMPETGSPIADYGSKFLLVAGLLNVLCILDTYDIAIGKKS